MFTTCEPQPLPLLAACLVDVLHLRALETLVEIVIFNVYLPAISKSSRDSSDDDDILDVSCDAIQYSPPESVIISPEGCSNVIE